VYKQIYSYGLQPYCGYSNQDAVELIRTHQLLTCPVGCPPRLYALLVDCWQRVPSTRPRFDVVRHRLRYCAADTRSGSASGASATTAGCCGTDGLYQPHPVCPPAACLQHDNTLVAQICPGPVERLNTPRREDGSVPSVTLVQNCPDEAHRYPSTANGDAVAVGTEAGVTTDIRPASRSRQLPSSAAGCDRQSCAVHRSTTSTSASTTPRNSHRLAHSSSSSASEAKSREVTSSELERLTSRARPH